MSTLMMACKRSKQRGADGQLALGDPNFACMGPLLRYYGRSGVTFALPFFYGVKILFFHVDTLHQLRRVQRFSRFPLISTLKVSSTSILFHRQFRLDALMLSHCLDSTRIRNDEPLPQNHPTGLKRSSCLL